MQSHFRGFFARKKFKSELESIKNYVLDQYQIAVNKLREKNKSSEAIDLIELIRKEKFVEAERKLRSVLGKEHSPSFIKVK